MVAQIVDELLRLLWIPILSHMNRLHTLTQNFLKIHLKFASMFRSLSFKFSKQNIKKKWCRCLYYTGSDLGPTADSCSDEDMELYGYRSTRNSLNFREIKHHSSYEYSSVLVLCPSSVTTASELSHIKSAVPRVDCHQIGLCLRMR
jgi:hypothetical protein